MMHPPSPAQINTIIRRIICIKIRNYMLGFTPLQGKSGFATGHVRFIRRRLKCICWLTFAASNAAEFETVPVHFEVCKY